MLFKRKGKERCFHVVFSATFEGGTRFVSSEMKVAGKGMVQSHILEYWRKTIMQEAHCTNAIILNFIEIDGSR